MAQVREGLSDQPAPTTVSRVLLKARASDGGEAVFPEPA